MQFSPSTHFVSFAQAILFRGAGFDVVWPQFLPVAVIGGLFLGLALCGFAGSPPKRRDIALVSPKLTRYGKAGSL